LAIGAQASAGELYKDNPNYRRVEGKTLIMQLYSIVGVNLLGRTEKWNLDLYIKPSIIVQAIGPEDLEYDAGEKKTGVRGEAGLSLIRWPLCIFFGYFNDKATMGGSYSIGVYF